MDGAAGKQGTGEKGRGVGTGVGRCVGTEGNRQSHTHTQGFGISLILIRRTTRNPRQPESVGQ